MISSVRLVALVPATAAIILAMPAAQSQELTNVAGVIETVNARNGGYGIVPETDRGTRYAPDRLPDEFKKDGLQVVFSGRVGQVDPGVRTWGIPLTLTNIEIAPNR